LVGSPLPLAAAESALTAALLAALAPVEATALALELGPTPADCGAGASAGGGGAAATAAPAAENQGGVVAEGGAAGLGAGAGGVRGYRYLGLDTSIAPGLDTPPMTSSFERLGYGRFGGPGTLAACGAATRALKAVPLRLTGGGGARAGRGLVRRGKGSGRPSLIEGAFGTRRKLFRCGQ
jgi:hypothetical protein